MLSDFCSVHATRRRSSAGTKRFATVLFCEVSEQIIPEDTPVGL